MGPANGNYPMIVLRNQSVRNRPSSSHQRAQAFYIRSLRVPLALPPLCLHVLLDGLTHSDSLYGVTPRPAKDTYDGKF